ncbi:MAG: hypothetical protein AAB425_03385, partial [Bdellovibrionota bacterium]
MSTVTVLPACGKKSESTTTTAENTISQSLATSLKTSLIEDGYSESDAETIAEAGEAESAAAAAGGAIRVERASAGKFAYRGTPSKIFR